MSIFPLDLIALLGTWGALGIFAIIGFGFGFALESSGFGNSTKLAAQFYFKDVTVFKVMFTTIIVAMVGIFAASAVGLVDYSMVYVNPTYLWPGILGGLIMGVGFIIGGFCPGTSLVAVSTGKLDGMFFMGGVLFGIFVFGESVSSFETFFNSSYMGRFTVPELLDLPIGTTVLLIVLVALALFLGAELLEQKVTKKPMSDAPKWRMGAAGGLVAVAVAVVLIGQPDHADRWNRISVAMEERLDQREVQISIVELVNTIWDDTLNTVLLDVRTESDFNQFHLQDAIHVTPDNLPQIGYQMLTNAPNSVVVVMSNDEESASMIWRYLVAERVANVYLLENGINGWLEHYGEDMPILSKQHEPDGLAFLFPVALGDRWEAALPEPAHSPVEFEAKIKLELPRGPVAGGCG